MICLFVQTTTNTNNIQYTLYVFRFRPKTIKPTERNNKMKSNLQRRKHANQGTTTKQRENSKKVVRKFKQNGRKWERKKFFFIVFQSIFFFFWLNEKFHLQLSRIFYFVEFSMWVCVCVCHEFHSTCCYFYIFLQALHLHGTVTRFIFLAVWLMVWFEWLTVSSQAIG